MASKFGVLILSILVYEAHLQAIDFLQQPQLSSFPSIFPPGFIPSLPSFNDGPPINTLQCSITPFGSCQPPLTSGLLDLEPVSFLPSSFGNLPPLPLQSPFESSPAFQVPSSGNIFPNPPGPFQLDVPLQPLQPVNLVSPPISFSNPSPLSIQPLPLDFSPSPPVPVQPLPFDFLPPSLTSVNLQPNSLSIQPFDFIQTPQASLPFISDPFLSTSPLSIQPFDFLSPPSLLQPTQSLNLLPPPPVSIQPIKPFDYPLPSPSLSYLPNPPIPIQSPLPVNLQPISPVSVQPFPFDFEPVSFPSPSLSYLPSPPLNLPTIQPIDYSPPFAPIQPTSVNFLESPLPANFKSITPLSVQPLPFDFDPVSYQQPSVTYLPPQVNLPSIQQIDYSPPFVPYSSPAPIFLESSPPANVQPIPFQPFDFPSSILQPQTLNLVNPSVPLQSTPTVSFTSPPVSVPPTVVSSVSIQPQQSVSYLSPPLISTPSVTILPQPDILEQTIVTFPYAQPTVNLPSVPIQVPSPITVTELPSVPISLPQTYISIPVLTPPPTVLPTIIPSQTVTIQPPSIPLISTTVINNSLTNSLANILQLVLTSRLVGSQNVLNSCNVPSLYNAIGSIGTSNVYSPLVQYLYGTSDVAVTSPVNYVTPSIVGTVTEYQTVTDVISPVYTFV